MAKVEAFNVSLPKKVRAMCTSLIKHEAGIRAALEHSAFGLDYDTVATRVITGRYHLYPMKASVLIMEVNEGKTFKHYSAVVATGDLNELVEARHMIEHAARQLGCTKLVIDGRRGWLREFKKHGWNEQTTIIEKSLEA